MNPPAQLLSLIILSFLILSGCSSSEKEEQAQTLKQKYTDYFKIGAAIGPGALKTDEVELIKQQFGSLTAENVMKIGPIHPKIDSFNWGPADEIADFARNNELVMRGHTLCWHSQVPDWLFIQDDMEVTRDTLLSRLKFHITSVVSRYKDVVYAWDVVNEAISDKEGVQYRQSKWFEIIGEDYIAKAFQYAQEVDPEAELFYNDYGIINPTKRDKIYTMIKNLLAKGVPIHGIGIQAHWSIEKPSEQQLIETIELFASLGLKIHITELDISIYPSRDDQEISPGEFLETREQKQIDQYQMIFRVFCQYKDNIENVTFWGISDRRSWLDNHPVRRRKNYPLLFDKDLQPKKAYDTVIGF
ncbi:MAG: endo-1,4-beta-xylanase [Bacteroidota bacterium]